MSGTTAILGLDYPDLDSDRWDVTYEGNLSTIDGLFHSTTGHTHSGAGTNGPKIPATSLSFDVATQAELDAHAAAANPHPGYVLSGGTFTGGMTLSLVASHAVGKATPTIFTNHSGDIDTGFYAVTGTNGRFFFSGNGEDMINLGGNGIALDKDFSYAFSSTGAPDGTPDVELMRVGAGVLGLVGRTTRGGTDAAPAPHAIAPYNYRDNADGSYERLFFGFSSNVAYIETQNSGGTSDANPLHIRTGGAQDLFWGTDGASRWKILGTNPFSLLPVATDSYNIGTGSRSGAADLDPATIYARTALVSTTDNGSECALKWKSEETTIAAAATTDTTITIPAGALVLAVSVRVTTIIPDATTFAVGISGDPTRYGTGLAVAAGTISQGTQAGVLFYASTTSIRITPSSSPLTNTGRVRVSIHYIELTPADS